MKTFIRTGVLLFAVIIALLHPAPAAQELATSPPALASAVGSLATSSAAGDSTMSVVSGDGRVVVFVSRAPNLVTNDQNGSTTDIFVRDLVGGTTRLVSQALNGQSGNGRSHAPSVSFDGGRIAFVSEASDLVAGDNNGVPDVFVRDLARGETLLLSVSADGAHSGSGPSDSPDLTPDGRFVVFESRATNLVGRLNNGWSHAFLRDIDSGITHWISEPTLDPSVLVSMDSSGGILVSSNGMTAVFSHYGSSLAPRPRNNSGTLYRRDVALGTTVMVDVWPSETTNATCTADDQRLSPDGRWLVARLNFSPAVRSNGVWRIDLQTGAMERLAQDLDTRYSSSMWLSSDGQRVALESRPPAADGTPAAAYSTADVNLATHGGPSQLLSTNEAWVDVPWRRRTHGELLAASRNLEFVAFSAYAPVPEGVTTNGPLQLWVIQTETGEVRRIGSPSASYDAPWVSFSADGQVMTFATSDDSLVPDDRNGASDIFAYQWAENRLQLVSVRHVNLAPRTPNHGSVAGSARLSSDGRRLAYTTIASDLVASDPNGAFDVFVRDLNTGVVRRVSTAEDGQSAGSGPSFSPSMSNDGQWIAFVSMATNLTTIRRTGAENIFLRDVAGGSTRLISLQSDIGLPGQLASAKPAVSPDGRLVAFETASELLRADRNGLRDIYLFDRTTLQVRLLTANRVTGAAGSGPSGSPVWSPDGRWLVFQSQASNLVAQGPSIRNYPYAWNSTNGSIHLLSRNYVATLPTDAPNEWMDFSGDSRLASFPVGAATSLSNLVVSIEDGSPVALIGGAWRARLDRDGKQAVWINAASGRDSGAAWVTDLATSTSTKVSVNNQGQPGNAIVRELDISPDGRFVFFTSSASNLDSAAAQGWTQLYARDLEAERTYLLSANLTGQAALGVTGPLVVSADGRFLVFSTSAPNLDGADFNGAGDFYMLQLHSSGTAPLISIMNADTGDIRLLWNAAESQSYRIEYKNDLTEPMWNTLVAPIQVQNGQGSAVDSRVHGDARSARFYRLVAD